MATTKAKTGKKARKPSSGKATPKKHGAAKGAQARGKKKPSKTKAVKSAGPKHKAAKKSTKKSTKKTAKKAAKKPSTALELRLDAAIYPKAILSQAAKAFAGLARIQIRKRGKEQIVTFTDADPDVIDRLPDEFANFALSYLVTQR